MLTVSPVMAKTIDQKNENHCICKCISMDCDWRWRYGTNRNFKGDWATLLPIAKSSGRDSSQMKIATTTTATKRYHVLESQPTNSYTVQMELWLDIAISFEFKQCITNGISSEIRENWMATREKKHAHWTKRGSEISPMCTYTIQR